MSPTSNIGLAKASVGSTAVRKRTLFLSIFFKAAVFLSQPAYAADPSGLWRDESGSVVKISGCGNGMCVEVVKPAKAGEKDVNNPDPALRNRSVVGITILNATRGGDNIWKGQLYNAEDGKTYSGTLTLASDAEMKLEGCAMNVFCRSRSWSRVK